MSGPKRKKQPSAFENAEYAANNDTSLTPEERERLFSGDMGVSIYNQENKIETTLDEKGNLIRPAGYGFTNIGAPGYKYNQMYQDYFVKAYEKLKKDKMNSKERIKLLTEQPGLSAQTRGQAALSLAGGAPSQGSQGSNALSQKARY